MENKKYFTFNVANDAINIIDEKDSRFARLDISICSTEPNAHSMIFSSDTLKKASKTLYMMPILAKFNEHIHDMEGHETDEVGLGGFFNNKEIRIEEKDGITYIKGIAYLWKNYQYVNDVLECLRKRDGEAAVSMEIEVDEDDMSPLDDGSNGAKVNNFVFQGVTILGKKVKPAIKSSRLQVLSFSELKDEYKKDFAISLEHRYDDIDFTIPYAVKRNVKKGMELLLDHNFNISSNAQAMSHTLLKEKLPFKKAMRVFKYLSKHEKDMFVKQEPYNAEYLEWLCYGGQACLTWIADIVKQMGEADNAYQKMFAIEVGSGKHYPLDLTEQSMVDDKWDDSEVRRLAIEDPDFVKIAPRIFMKLEDGWEDGGVDKLKYPIASVVDGKWVYNKKAIASALGYATKEGESEVKKKIESLFDYGKPEVDAEKKECAKDEVCPECGKNPCECAKEEEPKEKVEEEIHEDEHKEEEKVIVEEQAEEKPVEEPKEEAHKEEEMQEEPQEECEEEHEDEVEEEIEEEKGFEDKIKCVDPFIEERDNLDKLEAKEILEQMYHLLDILEDMRADAEVYMQEKKDLEEFKRGVEEQQKMAEVSKVLEDVKEDMSEEEKEEMRCQAKDFSLSNISVWENMVKAKAYESSQNKKKTFSEEKKVEEKVVRFANPWDGEKANTISNKTVWDDVM